MRAAEGDKLKQELDKTKKELKKYTKNQASWEKKVQSSLKQSDSQIAQLNVLTQKLNNNLPKSYASLSVELEQIRQHIQGLTGKYEETQFKNSQMSESLKELGQKINNFETNFSSIRGIIKLFNMSP